MIPCFLLEGGEKKERKKPIQEGYLPYLREGVWCYLTLLSTHRQKHIAQNIKIILITDNYCVKKKVSNEQLPVRTWLCPTDCKRKIEIITAEESSGLQENDAFLFDIFLIPNSISLTFSNHFNKVKETIQTHGQGSQFCSATTLAVSCLFFPTCSDK